MTLKPGGGGRCVTETHIGPLIPEKKHFNTIYIALESLQNVLSYVQMIQM